MLSRLIVYLGLARRGASNSAYTQSPLVYLARTSLGMKERNGRRNGRLLTLFYFYVEMGSLTLQVAQKCYSPLVGFFSTFNSLREIGVFGYRIK